MGDCWLAEPGMRPTFAELAEKIGEELTEGEQEHYLCLNKPFEEENEERQRKYVYLTSNNNKADDQQRDPGDGCDDEGLEMKPLASREAADGEMAEENTPMLDTPAKIRESSISFSNPGYFNPPNIVGRHSEAERGASAMALAPPATGAAKPPAMGKKRRLSSRSLADGFAVGFAGKF